MKLELLGVFLVILTLLFCRSALLSRNRKSSFSYEVRMSSWNNCWVTLRQNNNGALKKRKNKPPEKCYYPPSLPPSHHLWHSPWMGNITFSSPQVLIHFTYISKLNQPFLSSWRRQSLSLSADFSSKLRNLVLTKYNGNGTWSWLTCKTILEWAYKFVKLHICHGVDHVCPSDSFPGKYIVHGLDTGFQR